MMLAGLIAWTSIFWGPFLPPEKGNIYDSLVIDVNRTRAMVETVIPQTTIGSTARCKNVLLQMDQIANAIEEFNQTVVRDGKVIAFLYMSYGSKPEDFQRVLGEVDVEREKRQKMVMEARFKMKEVMTPAEWQAVFNPEK